MKEADSAIKNNMTTLAESISTSSHNYEMFEGNVKSYVERKTPVKEGMRR